MKHPRSSPAQTTQRIVVGKLEMLLEMLIAILCILIKYSPLLD